MLHFQSTLPTLQSKRKERPALSRLDQLPTLHPAPKKRMTVQRRKHGSTVTNLKVYQKAESSSGDSNVDSYEENDPLI